MFWSDLNRCLGVFFQCCPHVPRLSKVSQNVMLPRFVPLSEGLVGLRTSSRIRVLETKLPVDITGCGYVTFS